MAKKPSAPKTVEAFKHDDATRKNIPTAEYQAVLKKEQQTPIQVAYQRRNRDLDPQLVWRGKDEKDWSDLVVPAPPLYIQEKVHPKVLIDDLLAKTKSEQKDAQFDLFNDFNGVPHGADKTEFYQHDQNWTNRMILGDSLQVMASLAEREGLRGKVQCIYFDPPYGIKFNSNFQWSTSDKVGTTSDSSEKISREPEQVKAFRDTWRDGIHSYLTYLRDRLTAARDLLSESGSIFVQISDQNEHRLRCLMDEVFGDDNFIALIPFRKKRMPLGSNFIEQMHDFIIWYAKDAEVAKSRPLFESKTFEGDYFYRFAQGVNGKVIELNNEQIDSHAKVPEGYAVFWKKNLKPSGPMESGRFTAEFEGRSFPPPKNGYSITPQGYERLLRAGRITVDGSNLAYKVFTIDYPVTRLTAPWTKTIGASNKTYVVQTHDEVVKRCILMTTDPGDLILDPTCGSGTTAFVGEEWGRRWITIDTSRVALALARTRIMGAKLPYFILADSHAGQCKEAEVTGKAASSKPVAGQIRYGFVYERVPHITVGEIARNSEINVIWAKYQGILQPLLDELNTKLKKSWHEWEVPREFDSSWTDGMRELHADWWKNCIARQKEIDASIAAKADFEYLYDKPYEDKKKVRVAGPFTVESLSPHRMLAVDEEDGIIDTAERAKLGFTAKKDFTSIILENLKVAGVQQAHKSDKIDFVSLAPWPGELVCAEGRYIESGAEKRAAIFIGPEFGTVQRADLVTAAKEAAEASFDVLISCAFNYEAHTTDFSNLGRLPVLKARMNADLHMADDLKNTGKGNLFVIFGEPDIDLIEDRNGQVRVKVKGVDVFDPSSGEVRSDNADGIACWFIDTDYNEESFFVRHAYFLGANDPYSSLKTTLKAEIDASAWESLNSDTSRPFDKPNRGRIAVKVINHLGDEVMKVFRVK
jgi:adenine-specific DNA-methyltransferase